MNKKKYNIAIAILAAIILGCGIMAAGTAFGWFGGDEDSAQTADTAVTEEVVNEDASEAAGETEDGAGSTDTDAAATNKDTKTCTITIKCNTILNNMDKLDSAKTKYVPRNGVILSTSTIEFREGETVFDVSKRTCKAAGIPFVYKKSSMGYYVQGINNLFEFDCGSQSGWLYSVNGSMPNHASSAHSVKNGDKIVWHYTCEE